MDEQRPQAGGIERRVAPRATYLSPARLLRGDDTLDGRLQNLSESGLLISLPGGSPAPGESVVIRFALPISGNVVSLAAVAVRLAPCRTGGVDLGVRFVDPPEEAQKEIARFVAALAPPEASEG